MTSKMQRMLENLDPSITALLTGGSCDADADDPLTRAVFRSYRGDAPGPPILRKPPTGPQVPLDDDEGSRIVFEGASRVLFNHTQRG